MPLTSPPALARHGWLLALALSTPAAADTPFEANRRLVAPFAEAIDTRSGKTVRYQVFGDTATIGDIAIGSHAEIQRNGLPALAVGPANPEVVEQKSRRKRAAPFIGATLWPGNSVYYSLERANARTRRAFFDAVDEIESVSSLRFFERGTQAGYVNVISHEGPCRSVIGRSGGAQALDIASHCEFKGAVLHELMHALGFGHEHERSDRNRYVTIDPGAQSWLKIDQRVSTQWPYDPVSIMHYDLPEIRPLDPTQKLNPLENLSPGDVQALNALYPGAAPAPARRQAADHRPGPAASTAQDRKPAPQIPSAQDRRQEPQAPSAQDRRQEGAQRREDVVPPPPPPPPALRPASLSAGRLEIEQGGVGRITVHSGSRPLAGMGMELYGTRQFEVNILVRGDRERELVFKPFADYSGDGHFDLTLHFANGESQTLPLDIRVEAGTRRNDGDRQLVARSSGLCLQPRDDDDGSGRPGRAVVLSPCRPVETQRWTHLGSGDILNSAYPGHCLTRLGSEARLQPCRQLVAQLWSYDARRQLLGSAGRPGDTLRDDGRGSVRTDAADGRYGFERQWDWR